MGGGGLDTRLRETLDRRLGEIDQMDVVAVVRLEVPGLERKALQPEAMVLRDQLLGDLRVVDPPADAVRDVVRQLLVRGFVEEDLREVRGEDREPGLVVQLVPERLGSSAVLSQNPQRGTCSKPPGEALQLAKISS